MKIYPVTSALFHADGVVDKHDEAKALKMYLRRRGAKM
jgi:hypothetical protein